VPYGLDLAAYRRMPGAPRDGVSAYIRTANDRRGYLLVRAALERFHELHPEQPIHLFGDAAADWGFPVVSHGHLTPAALNGLYNRVHGGLALSFTNISLVAGEMLAAGAVPVQNDDPFARAGLDHPDAVWAEPTPEALARALAEVVERSVAAGGLSAVAPIDAVSWDETAAAVAVAIEGDDADAPAGHPHPEALAAAQEAPR
jgi:hypothetical protein